MFERIKCPVKRVMVLLNQLENNVQSSRDLFLIRELKEIAIKISKGIGTKKTLIRFLELISQSIPRLSPELKHWVRGVEKEVRNSLEVFENHLELKICIFEECELLIPAPCQVACPANIDIPTFISLIGQRKYKEAVDVIRKDNPFPWICGLVCTHPCEESCIRGKMDKPVSIMNLKSFVSEVALSIGDYRNPDKLPPNGRKVCVIGGGPAGLTCAYFLALWGYHVTVVEALPVMGGMMRVGIPAYRLPREVIEREIGMIEELGVEFRLNTRFGIDVTFESLRQEGFEAFMISIGAHDCYRLNIQGEDLYKDHIFPAVEFLRDVNLGNLKRPGDRVVVVGGGNVAIDAARTCIRLGCREVVIAYRRSESQMPADPMEVREAREEGVKFAFLTIPKEVVGDGNRLTGLMCIKARLVDADASGRPKPVPIEGSEFIIETDAIIPAIGQKVDRSCMENFVYEPCDLDDVQNKEVFESLRWTKKDTIEIVNYATMQTNLKGVFAAGDVVLGPATVVEAIGGGKRAAYGIHRYLQKLPPYFHAPFPARRGREGFFYLEATEKQSLKRVEEDFLSLKRRKTTFQQVHLGFDEDAAIEETRRCLRCDVCIRCGRCVEVCRDEIGVNALHLGYITGDITRLYITQELCVGCGSCARNCPTGAMKVEDAGGYRILSLCGTVLSKLPLVVCKECGQIIGTKKFIEFMNQRIEHKDRLKYREDLCDRCARIKEARGFVLV